MKKSTLTEKKILQGAIAASHAAGEVLLRHFRRKLRVREKPGAGLVSNADLAAERIAMRELRRICPEFAFLTEESGKHPPSGHQTKGDHGRWILDPLDGTTNFVHGFPVFCVSIGAEWEGEMIAGVIHQPVLGETFTAIKGGGAFLNGKRIQVSTTRRFSDALLTTGFSYRKEALLKKELGSFHKFSQATRAIRRPGSAALDLAYVACGIFDGFWERGLSPWDLAAGILLVKEAGGKVTDFKGNTPDLRQGEVLASNGRVHKEMLRILSTQRSGK